MLLAGSEVHRLHGWRGVGETLVTLAETAHAHGMVSEVRVQLLEPDQFRLIKRGSMDLWRSRLQHALIAKENVRQSV